MQIKQTVKKISSSITKIALVFVVISTIIILFSAFTRGDKITINPEETTRQQRKEIYALINNPQYQKTPDGKIGIAIYRAMLCGAIGEACTDNPEDGDENYNRSIFGFVGNLMVMPYANPPASGMYFAYDSLKNAGFIPRAYAAEGIGFASIKPIIGVWKAFRNITYLILVLILVFIGFMVMFRMKLNPQTVISVENTLPKIVISLILITFSFAIAGFLIDLMYLAMGIVLNVLSKTGVGELQPDNFSELQSKYFIAGFDDLWPFSGIGIKRISPFRGDLASPFQVGGAIARLIPAYGKVIINGLAGFIALHYTLQINTKSAGSILKLLKNIFINIRNMGAEAATFGFNLGWSPGLIWTIIEAAILVILFAWGTGTILGLLFYFTLLLLQFRIFFMLLVAYIKSLILIVFSPVFCLFEAIPGKKPFSFWFKSLIGELVTFPIVVTLLLVGYAISQTTLQQERIFQPPFLFSIDAKALAALIGMGIILVIPQVVKLTKELFGIKGLPDFKPGFFSGAAVGVGGALGMFGQFSTLTLGLPGLRERIFRFLPKPWQETAAEAAKRLAQEKQLGEHGGE